MFTLFHLFALFGIIAGIVLGGIAGWQWLGWLGLVVGSLAGFCVGAIIGQLPLVLVASVASRKFVRMTTEELREYLHADDCLTPNFVLLELNRRGADISIELPCLYSRLTSDDSNQRSKAWVALSSAFPELVEKIPDYRPFEPVEDCRRNAEPLKIAVEAATKRGSTE